MKKGVEDLPKDSTRQAKKPGADVGSKPSDSANTRAGSKPSKSTDAHPSSAGSILDHSSSKPSKPVNTRSSKAFEGIVWFAVILIVLAVLGFGVWGEIRLASIVEPPEIPVNGAPTESPIIIEEAIAELDNGEYRQTLQEIYQQNLDSGNSIDAVSQAVQERLDMSGDKIYIAKVRLTEIELMNANGNHDRALELLGGLTAEDLAPAERARYYNAMATVYQAQANYDLANEYARLAHEAEKEAK